MNRWVASFVLPVLLAGTAAFLAVRLIDEARLLGDAAAVEAGAAEDRLVMALARDTAPAEPALPDPAEMRVVLERPLFSPTRRPPVRVAAEPEPDPAGPAERPELQLHGIVVVGEARIALLGGEASGPLLRVGTGDEIAGWHVLEIGIDTVVLQRGDHSYRIRLDYHKDGQ